MLAPAAPFLSDWLHRALTGTSVHLARFPVVFGPAGRGAGGGDGSGAPAGLAGPRRPGRAWTPGPAAAGADAGRGAGRGARCRRWTQLLELLRVEVNVKQVDVVASDTELVRLRARAQLPLAGQALRQADAGGSGGGRAAQQRSASRAGAGRAGRAGRGRRARRRSCPRTWWWSATWRATGWWRATAPTWRRSIRDSTRGSGGRGSPGRW